MLPISERNFDTATDHGALFEDLAALGGNVTAGLADSIPLAALEVLGGDLLNAAPGDFGALPIRWDPEATFELGNMDAFLAFGGKVRVPLILGAAAAGRTDLRNRFIQQGRFVAERALQWLVCHGINEHRLWHALRVGFVGDLLRPSIQSPVGMVPPLGFLLMQERPDLRGRFTPRNRWSASAFTSWLGEYGIKDYGLFWCLGKSEVRQWNGRDWPVASSNTTTASPGPIDVTAAHFLSPAKQWIEGRTAAWQKAGRLYPAFALEASSLAARLVSDSRIVPSHQWLAFAGSRLALLSPRQRIRESFIAVEFRPTGDTPSPFSASLALNGLALPTGLIAGNQTLTAVAWTAGSAVARGDAGKFDLLVLDLTAGLGEGTRNSSFEVLRIWNF